MTKKILAIFMVAFLLGIVAGCSDDDSTTPETGEDDPVVYATPDDLLAAFQQACEDLDPDLFSNLLHEDFRCHLQQDTIDDYGLAQDYFDREEEIGIHGNIFSGEPLDVPGGGTIPAVSSIAFTTFERQGIWTAADEEHPDYPGEPFATYNIKWEYARSGGTTMVVTGFVQFYVHNAGDEQDGDYTLIGAADLTNGKTTEQTYWGDVQALYLPRDG